MAALRPSVHDGGWGTPPGLRAIETLELPPEPCPHALGEWNHDGEIICAACGASIQEDTP